MLLKKNDLMFGANAKLLLTGEYLVMAGASALAMPLQFGQSLTVSYLVNEDLLHWTASDKNGIWFKAGFKTGAIIISKSSDEQTCMRLQTILKAARSLNPQFLLDGCGYDVQTYIDFERQWGWGTSSTLIVNIASWANVDPFKLHFLVNHGSAYDIACGIYPTPILYQLTNNTPKVTPVELSPVFQQHSYFIYLGKKENTEKNISTIPFEKLHLTNEIKAISEITDRFLHASDPEQLMQLLIGHELIISTLLNEMPVQKKYFNDFQGAIKSLGAWGGDFILAITTQGKSYVKNYFQMKDYPVIFLFSEIYKR